MPQPMHRAGAREFLFALAVSILLTAALTYPLAFHPGHLARLDTTDGQFSIWNVAWVAHALTTDPRHLLDANMFYPHRGTLVYSEANLGAGVLAVPAYWLTQNPYLAHNASVLLAFVLSLLGMYYLVRHLTGNRGAAWFSAVAFAFSPCVMCRMPHIQLLMTAGLPWSLLATHRLVARPSPARGLVLGLVLAGQAYSSGYYGIFAGLLAGYAIAFHAVFEGRWRSVRYWASAALAAAVAVGLVLPLFVQYVHLQQATGFHRGLAETTFWSAKWQDYLASPAHAHAWMLRLIPRWRDVLFPGLLTVGLGMAGVWIGWRTRRNLTALYASAGILAAWMSFGPAAGLYRLAYAVLPAFSLIRAASRFGVVVTLALAVLAGFALAAWLPRLRRPALASVALAGALALELAAIPLAFTEVPPVPPVYRLLAILPPGPVVEYPFYYNSKELYVHSRYLLNSTAHWHPLINGYSDYIPADFYQHAPAIARLDDESFRILASLGTRYLVVHDTAGYSPPDPRLRLERRLRPLQFSREIWLFEIVN